MTKDVEARFVGLASATSAVAGHGAHPCQGLYWTPRGARPKTALIATHYNVDFAEHYLGPLMAARGFGFLGWNTRYRGAEDLFNLEQALVDIGAGADWLRAAGAERLIILGNSGGASLMSAYQATATRGGAGLDASGRTAEALAELPAADLFVSLNAHPGRPEVLTSWMDASVVDETDPMQTDPALDPFDAANGPPYAADFVARYRAAQIARNQHITDWAKGELERLALAGIPDRIFPLFRTWADLRFMDGAIDPSERKTPLCYAGDPARANRGPLGIGRANTLRTWLSMWSLETSRCRGALHLPHVTVPALVIQSTHDAGVFPSDGRAIFEALASADKRLETPPGAHYFEDAPARREAVADLIAGWIEAH
ncbi:MAG TPA: alpha/beta hydrolase [Caulobacteraceae bacterium]|nr:alpha/beta hydrolase [Caulobacteraceae bacterium]